MTIVSSEPAIASPRVVRRFAQPALADSKHIPALDGLRGIAIAMVLGHHFFLEVTTGNRILDTLFKVLGFGWCGVDLFFVLSGFLITGILLDTKSRPHFFRNFYMRRTLRIFPLYYATLFVLLLLAPAAMHLMGKSVPESPHSQWWFWLYGTNILLSVQNTWGTGTIVSVDHFWSLAVEEHFYLVWPLVVYLSSPRTLLRICCVVIVGAFAARLITMLEFSNAGIPTYVLTPFRADTLVVGGLAALLVRTPENVAKIRRFVPWMALAFLLLIAFTKWNRYTFFGSTAGYSMLALLFVAILLMAVTGSPTSPLRRVLSISLLRSLGRYSYGIYVYHRIVQGSLTPEDLQSLLSRTSLGPLALLFLHRAVILTLSLAVAFVSWHLFEKQFLKLKRYFESTPAVIAEKFPEAVISKA